MAQVALSPNPEPGFCDEPSRFQELALEVGVSEDELRGLLLRLIAKKCARATPRQLVVSRPVSRYGVQRAETHGSDFA